ncbi:hypothetical protein HPP92_022054 [Vanilla planifolia]|uniref:RRM domain-containing protein n=1 Tax=Vanilla planifolia TaxID=51239 RepID=A0A835PV02_VANPL|nr:hypothetical protein HPP92_022054 [Vanilla planifolia]
MSDSPRRRYSRSSYYRNSRSLDSRSRSRGRSQSRSRSSEFRSWSRSASPSQGREDARNPGNTLYVTGLSSRVTERELEDHFSNEGNVIECHLIVEPWTRISRGFAFVTMETTEEADRCVKYLNQSVLGGRYITVEKSRRKRGRTPTPGQYLGLKNSGESSYRHMGDRTGYRGGDGRDEYYDGYRRSPRRSSHRSPYHGDLGGRSYSPRHSPYYGRRDEYYDGYRRSPRRSPYRSPYHGGRNYSPRRSPYYGGRYRRDRSRSLPFSPYGSPEREDYGRRSKAYAR